MALRNVKYAMRQMSQIGELSHDPVYVADRIADIYVWSRLNDGGVVAGLLEEMDRNGWELKHDAKDRREGDVASHYGLTRVEAEIAFAFAQGYRLNEIAETRSVSINTVRTHFSRVKDKLGVRTQAQALRKLIAS